MRSATDQSVSAKARLLAIQTFSTYWNHCIWLKKTIAIKKQYDIFWFTESNNNICWKGTPEVVQSYSLLKAGLITLGYSGQRPVIHVLWPSRNSREGSSIFERQHLLERSYYQLFCSSILFSLKSARVFPHAVTWGLQPSVQDC